MARVSYLIRLIVNMDYKKMFIIAKDISVRAHKNLWLILFDIIKCGIVFQAGYYDYQEFEFYNLNSEQRKTYLTRGKNNEIVKRFNDKASWYKFDNKIEFNKIFNSYLHRKWIGLDGNNFEAFFEFFKASHAVIVKPINGIGGQGVEKYVFENETDYKVLYNKLINSSQLLIEEYIHQHPDMNALYDVSVNTLRMFTFIKNGQVHFLQAILKIGNGTVVDNFSGGGMYTYVDNEGTVFVNAIDQNDNVYSEHPVSKQKIVGFKIPMFKEAVEMVEAAAKVVPEIAYVGWDVAVSQEGPLIVEGNCYPGVYQVKPSLHPKREGLIPKYNEIMGIF